MKHGIATKSWAKWLVPLLLMLALSACATAATQPVPTEPTEAVETPEPAFPVTVTDGLGGEVTMTKLPVRIVSLTLGTDEILLDLVGPERLIAVTYLAATPASSSIADRAELKEIKNTVEADPEQVIALEPDLVFVASFTQGEVVDQLKNAGITVFVVGNFTSIQAMEDNILTIGRLVGESDNAQAIVDDMEAQLAEAEATVSKAEGGKPTVLYLTPDGWVAGSATTVDDIITRAGGVNAAGDLVDWNQLSPEKIIELDPDVVILSPYVTDAEFAENPAYASLAAVQNGRIYPLSDAHMSATSQYIVLAVQDVVKVLYPELAQP